MFLPYGVKRIKRRNGAESPPIHAGVLVQVRALPHPDFLLHTPHHRTFQSCLLFFSITPSVLNSLHYHSSSTEISVVQSQTKAFALSSSLQRRHPADIFHNTTSLSAVFSSQHQISKAQLSLLEINLISPNSANHEKHNNESLRDALLALPGALHHLHPHSRPHRDPRKSGLRISEPNRLSVLSPPTLINKTDKRTSRQTCLYGTPSLQSHWLRLLRHRHGPQRLLFPQRRPHSWRDPWLQRQSHGRLCRILGGRSGNVFPCAAGCGVGRGMYVGCGVG